MAPSLPYRHTNRCVTNGQSVTHTTSSPRYSHSNGVAERTVHTIELVMIKCQKTGQDITKALLNLRATPMNAHLPSPAEILFGRPFYTILPSNNPLGSSKQPELVNDCLVVHPDLPQKFVGQTVRILDQPTGKLRVPDTVTKICAELRSYEVTTPNGTTVRQNRSHLRDMHGTRKPQAAAPRVAKHFIFMNTLPAPYFHNICKSQLCKCQSRHSAIL